MSLALVEGEEEEVVLGAPGAWNWTGTPVM